MSDIESVAEIHTAYTRRDVSPSEIVARSLDRIQRLDPQLHAFLYVAGDHAVEAAKVAEAEIKRDGPKGPLHGVPFAIKDIIDRAGYKTTAQSLLLEDNFATSSADCVRRLEKAGAIYIGKLATHEFAIGGPSFDLPAPPARNPWNNDYFTGGSSSGSGAAVAARMVPLALGTDTGGSVRNPAAMCGIVGMKPTRETISRKGVVPLSFSLDTVGPMTTTVLDNAISLDVLAKNNGSARIGYAENLTTDLSGVRIGVVRRFYSTDMTAALEMTRAIGTALDVLRGLGAELIDIDVGALSDYAMCNRIILTSEAYAFHRQWLQDQYWDYSCSSRERILPGGFISAADYVDALRWRRKLSERFNAAFEDVDAAVTVTNMDPPARLDDVDAIKTQYGRHARAPFNVTGNPAMSVPVGFSSDGLPLAMQIVGQYHDERTVYQIGHAYEREVPSAFAVPPIAGD